MSAPQQFHFMAASPSTISTRLVTMLEVKQLRGLPFGTRLQRKPIAIFRQDLIREVSATAAPALSSD